jgi:PAS domain S-box-containing protein
MSNSDPVEPGSIDGAARADIESHSAQAAFPVAVAFFVTATLAAAFLSLAVFPHSDAADLWAVGTATTSAVVLGSWCVFTLPAYYRRRFERDSSRLLQLRSDERDALMSRIDELERLVSELRLSSEAHKAAAEQLEKTRLRYQALLDASPLAICAVDLDGTVQTWNRSAERIFGWTQDEVLGKPVPYVPANLRHETASVLSRLAGGEECIEMETRRRCKDGRIADVSVSAAPVRDEAGTVVQCMALVADVTARKEIELALRTSEDRMHKILSSASAVVFCLNFDWALLYISPNSNVELKWEKHAIEGCKFDKFFHPDDFEGLCAAVDSLRSEAASNVSVDSRIRIGDATWRWYGCSASLVKDSSGRPLHVVVVAVDVSAKKEAERALLEAKEAAEAASRSKTHFLANMSHELRTPMNSIIGFSEILQDRHFGELNDKQDKYVGNILSSGRHLLRIINDILDLSKIEAGHTRLDLGPVPVIETMRSVEDAVRVLASNKRIELNVEVDPTVSSINADAARLRQILFNLLSNAIKFTPEGGIVEMDAAMIDAPARSLRICVRDSGVGIRAEDRERIFRRFEQVGASAKGQQGTGLGLALTRRLVELHDGKVWVESEGDGKGSTFIVLLPVSPEDARDMGVDVARAA